MRSKGGHELIEVFCTSCKKSRGYMRKRYCDRLCRSCSARTRPSNPNEGNFGPRDKKHKHVNVDYSDYICLISSGHSRYLFRTRCLKCGADKGYVVHNKTQVQCRTCMGDEKRMYDADRKRLKKSVSSSIYHRLKRRDVFTLGSKVGLLDFTVEELFRHIENLFEPGMSWDNYGYWHIDHKIPDAWFSYSSPEDDGFKESWALSNLQPKWATENISKGCRYSD